MNGENKEEPGHPDEKIWNEPVNGLKHHIGRYFVSVRILKIDLGQHTLDWARVFVLIG